MTGRTRIFVTGGAGFIGAALCQRLAALGHDVTSYDNYLPQVHGAAAGMPMSYSAAKAAYGSLSAAGVTDITGDIRDAGAVEHALRKSMPEIVFHLASETGTGQSFDAPAHYVDVNVTGTATLIEAMRTAAQQVKHIVLAGSRAVYGEGAYVNAQGTVVTAPPRTPEALNRGIFEVSSAMGEPLIPVATRADLCPANPASVYASTKLMQEHLLFQALLRSDPRVTVLRLQNVYGPGQSRHNPYTGVLSVFTEAIAEGHAPTVFEDGEITRDFVFIDDVIRALVQTLTISADAPNTLDIGSGQGTTIAQAAHALMRMAGRNPGTKIKGDGTARPGDVRHALADLSVSRRALGWEPRTAFEDGLHQLWASRAPKVTGAW